MTIGIDCRLYSPKFTGIGRYVFELVQQLVRQDRENHYILYFNQPEFDAFQVPNERWQKKLVNIRHYSMDEQTRFAWFLNHEPVDLIHFPHFNAPVLCKKPFVVTIHDLTLHYYPYKSYTPRWTPKKALEIFVYRQLMGRIARKAQHIIAVSENTKNDLVREYQLSSEKISTVYEGVPEHFQKASEAEIQAVLGKFAIRKPYLLYTGVWRSHKNLLRLLEAFKRITDSGQDVQLVLTGKKDPVYPEIPEAIKRFSLQERVVLTGFVDDTDLIALMSGATVYVFPSLYEGFGLPPLEAMQLGVPVACSHISSLPEVCGDAAMYFDPKNVQEMADKVLFLLKNQQVRQEYIEKGKKNVERFSWSQMASQILDIYRKIGKT